MSRKYPAVSIQTGFRKTPIGTYRVSSHIIVGVKLRTQMRVPMCVPGGLFSDAGLIVALAGRFGCGLGALLVSQELLLGANEV